MARGSGQTLAFDVRFDQPTIVELQDHIPSFHSVRDQSDTQSVGSEFSWHTRTGPSEKVALKESRSNLDSQALLPYHGLKGGAEVDLGRLKARLPCS